jgi:hypothetical protein
MNMNHCENSRLMLLFRILSSLDKFYITERASEKSKAISRATAVRGAGVGFGSGYAGVNPNVYFHTGQSGQSQEKPKTAEGPQRDEQLKSFYRGIGWILKTGTGKGILEIMQMSVLSTAMEELLRNDSISDCSDRAVLYASFLSAVEGIGLHPGLSEFYTMPRETVEYTDGLEKLMLGEGNIVKTPGGENGMPLLDIMDHLAKSAERFYKTANHVSGLNIADTNVINSINLCRSILSIRELLRRTSQSHSIEPQTSKETYSSLCSKLAYDEFPFDFAFHFTTVSMAPTPTNPKRTLTLAKELSTMATSLPPGIFIRSQQNRPDCIKALIAGPEGTPYYHGLFEFDIFATPNYPAEAPKVHFLTTAGGRVRFNPNLYAYLSHSKSL